MKSIINLVFILIVTSTSGFAQSYIDTTFGEKGITYTFVNISKSTTNRVSDLIVLPDDKVVVVGQSYFITSYIPGMAKYNSNGSIDTTFGSNKGTLPFHDVSGSGSYHMYNIASLSNNNLLVLGNITTAGPLLYYTREVSIDGKSFFNSPAGHFYSYGLEAEINTILLRTMNGDLYLSGTFYSRTTPEKYFALLKINKEYGYDATFGDEGFQKTLPLAGYGGAYDGIITKNNKILLGGYSQDAGGLNGFQLIQFLMDGSIDTTFGYKGFVRLQISSSILTNLEIDSEGKIYAIGFANAGGKNVFCVFRLNSDGSIDYSFSDDGVETYEFPLSIQSTRSVVQKDGKLILGGYYSGGSCLIRINPDGKVDESFGEQGRIILNDLLGLRGLGIQSDGKIIAGGYVIKPLPVDLTKYGEAYAITRILPNKNYVDVKDEQNIITSFKLDQNYPNPFNPSTTINFSLPEASDVTLKVYDVLGKEVASLINERKEAGDHTVSFNAENLSAGMYIYKLTAGSNTVSKKMMLVK